MGNIYEKGEVKRINKKNIYTKEQLQHNKEFKNVYLNVYAHNFETKAKGENRYITVYEVRGKSKEERENYESVNQIFNKNENGTYIKEK